jgi:hypothetical protein
MRQINGHGGGAAHREDTQRISLKIVIGDVYCGARQHVEEITAIR